MPEVLRRLRADLVFCPANVDVLARPCPSILLIQNILPFSLGHSDRNLRVFLLRRMSEISICRADHTVFLSESAREVVETTLSLPADRTSVIHLGWNPFFNPHPSANSAFPVDGLNGRPYLLSVGEYRPHKNFDALCQAFAAIRRELPEDLHLLIVGPIGDRDYYARLQTIVNRLRLSKRVVLHLQVPYASLPSLYVGALAYLQPSRIESFPHTLLEAMGCGCAIGCSTMSAGTEICGEAALHFDAFDTLAMADTIRRLVLDPALRAELARRALQRVREYSWSRTAADTLALFRRVGRDTPEKSASRL
jgi:glycosyltransferase involved in cell wall biosynthesis